MANREFQGGVNHLEKKNMRPKSPYPANWWSDVWSWLQIALANAPGGENVQMLVSFGGCYIVIMLRFAKDAWNSSNMTDVPMVISSMVESGSKQTPKQTQNKYLQQPGIWNSPPLKYVEFPLKTKRRNLIFFGYLKTPKCATRFHP